MSIIGSNVLAGASGSGVEAYQIEQSLRSGADNQNLKRTPATSGNKQTWTWSGWIKRGELGAEQHFFESWEGVGDVMFYARFHSNDTIRVKQFQSGDIFELQTNAVFRDPSAWYHVVLSFDTTQATSSDRAKIYVNGELQSLGTASYPSQNLETFVNQSGYIHHLFADLYTSSRSFNGYMAEVHLIDGTALDPTDFGETNNDGVWVPIEYTGSHGTEGWYMKFDETATNGIGHDHSGNGNNLTNSNFTTSGTGTDVMSDTPTTNWCALNPLIVTGRGTISNGNLDYVSGANTAHGNAAGSFALPTSGKWYWEVTSGKNENNESIGVANILNNPQLPAVGSEVGSRTDDYIYRSNGVKRSGGSTSSVTYGSTFTGGDIIGVKWDSDSGTIGFSKNGTDHGTAYSSITQVEGKFVPAASNAEVSSQTTFNFGQREFLYPPGTYSASDYFNTVTWTGDNNDDRSITVGFQPDLVWYKRRNLSASYVVFDSVRGATKALSSNNTTTENTEANALQAFETNGFQVGSDANSNSSSYNYVAWCWKAGGTASSNTDGSITASVSASDAAGFSVVKFEGNNTANASVGHGLSTAPSFIITKNIDNSSAYWATFHASAGESSKMYINDNQAPDTGTQWLDVSDSTITWKQTGVNNVNTNSNTFICYCWAEKTGVSKFGSYTGNGNVDGPLVSDLGFAPALLVIKRNGTSEWAVYDSARGNDNQLRWDTTDQDNTNSAVNVRLTSNGFKIATSDAAQNSNGDTYYYMAWARNFSADADYKVLNTANLSAPEIADGSDYFNTVLYTGNGSTQSITGVNFQPDFAWIKGRNNSDNHTLHNAVAGATKYLYSNSTASEVTTANSLTSFDSDGFSLGSAGIVNRLNDTYVAWNWLAGGSTSSNTNGSITSTVSVNATAGFSIVQFDGTGANGSIGHGLGVAPSFIVAKSKTHADNWFVYHSAIGANGYIMLNQTAAVDSPNSTVWQNVSPTSTVFYASTGGYNDSGETIIAYCFAEVEGYSKMGTYTGSTGFPFVYCGFRPAFILLKPYDLASGWYMYDSTRGEYNVVSMRVLADTSDQETSAAGNDIDILSNGFKLRGASNSGSNYNGKNYIFYAVAENPFGGSGVSPATAR